MPAEGRVLDAQIFGSIRHAVLLIDSAGLICEASSRADEMFGYELGALVGLGVDLLVPAPLRKAHVRHRATYAKAPSMKAMATRLELVGVRADGTEFPVDIGLSPLESPAGLLTVAVVADQSERVQWQANQERRARSVLDSSLDAYHSTDLQGLVTEWNKAAEAMYGWSRDEALGRPLAELIIPERHRAEARRNWSEYAESGEGSRIGKISESIGCRRDGTEFPMELTVTVIGEGDQTRFHAFVRDISERKKAKEQQARAAAIVTSSQDGIAALDLDRKVVVWNPALEQMFGVTEAQALDRRLSEILPLETIEQVDTYIESALAGQVVSYTQQSRRPDGSLFTISARLGPVFAVGGTVAGVSVHIRDTTAQEQAEAAAQDSQERLRSIVDNTGAAISMRDRNFRFLLTNRAFRQSVGLPLDEEIVGRLDTDVLPEEAIARLRVSDQRVLSGVPVTQEETVTRGRDQRTLLSQWFPLTDARGQVYAIVEVTTDVTDSKHAERELRERRNWEEQIGGALNEGRLLVYAQPIIDIASGELCGEELLVRMQGENGPHDVVRPDDFLPQAERFGLMPMIDRFMLGEAIKLASTGRRISVNVSATSIRTPALADQVIAQLATAPQAAPNLTFEITETAALASPGAAQYFSACIAALGAGLALDDFGTGYGSLTELRTLKVQSLKIDLSFVRNLASSAEDQRVVKLIIHIAKTFGITTTAEGIEDREALDLLREYGADRAQGYFIGRPAPVEY